MPTAAPDTDNRKIPAEAICESCGAEFSCGANIGECWCFALEIKPESLAEWRKKFKDCLCEICLSETKARRISEKDNFPADETD